MGETSELTVVFRPAISGRGAIEDDLEDVLQERGLGEVVGAGAATDGSLCDLHIVVTDLDAGLQAVREILRQHQVPESTVLAHHGTDRVVYPIYG
jgi:hypothetical protein